MLNTQVGQYRQDVHGIVELTSSKMDTVQAMMTLTLCVCAALSDAGRIGMHGCAPPQWLCALYSGGLQLLLSLCFGKGERCNLLWARVCSQGLSCRIRISGSCYLCQATSTPPFFSVEQHFGLLCMVHFVPSSLNASGRGWVFRSILHVHSNWRQAYHILPAIAIAWTMESCHFWKPKSWDMTQPFCWKGLSCKTLPWNSLSAKGCSNIIAHAKGPTANSFYGPNGCCQIFWLCLWTAENWWSVPGAKLTVGLSLL